MLTVNGLKKATLCGILVLSSLSLGSSAQAQFSGRVFAVNTGVFSYSWGWFGPWIGVRFPVRSFGASYYRYWNFQPRYASYGSISYSPESDTFGYDFGHFTRQRSVASSQRACGEEDCQPLVWVQGGCAAVASIPGGDHMGWAYAPSKHQAKSMALRGCFRSQGARDDCHIRQWVCSN